MEVPSFRQDIEGMADLAEEVARIWVYKIPMTLMEDQDLKEQEPGNKSY